MADALELRFDFSIVGELPDDALLDSYEIGLMFSQTQRELSESLERKLGLLLCSEHQQAASLLIVGHYDALREEMDIQYHIDPCCPLFMARIIKTLNAVN